MYKMRNFVSLTGFSATLLRAWERRFDLFSPRRTDSGHRAYSAEDLRRAQQIKLLLAQGRNISEIVDVVKSSAPHPANWLEKMLEQIWFESVNLDSQAVHSLLDALLARFSYREQLQRVILPLLHEQRDAPRERVARRLLKQCLASRLEMMLSSRAGNPGGRLAMCCSLAGGLPWFPLSLVDLWLLDRGFHVINLGVDVAPEAVLAAAIRLRPSMLTLAVPDAPAWERARPELLRLASELPDSEVLLMGEKCLAESPWRVYDGPAF
ncbi:MAG: MerR family transcriptional regulator [Candidatus Eremiobacteraeota bacterium]|nr:MerR family transcriptional regulator [Candidatus Eremiobacteraeota bacterium]